MNFFKNNPFVRLVLIQLAGIAAAIFMPYPVISVFIVLAFFLIWWRLTAKSHLINQIWLESCLLAITLALVMVIRVNSPDPIPQLGDRNQHVLLQLLEKPVKKKNSWQAETYILKAENDSLRRQKIITYIAPYEGVEGLRAGDLIYAEAYLNTIENQGVPYEFDYKGYMNRQDIFFSAYLPAQNIIPVQVENPPVLLKVERFREKLINILRYNLNESTYQVASALTLGYRADMSKEIQSYFTSTGSIHVLSVSGMHVGMVFLILNVMLGFLKRSRKGVIAYQICVIIILWFYALLTGLCPPVNRATIMFTVFILGESLKRPVSNYNSIAVSAFILLFLNPQLIFDVGFQLSYLSMISIFFFYPLFEKIFQPSNKIIRVMWQLMCISFAAQIGVFPLSVFYFHQFPIFFWLSNIFVAPVAYFYIIFSAIILVFNSIEPIVVLFSALLNYTNALTLWLLEKIANLPGAVVNLSISRLQVTCLFVAIGFIITFIEKQRRKYLFATLAFMLFFQVAGLTEKALLLNQEKLIVYKSDTPLIHLINGRDNYLISASDEIPVDYLYRNVLEQLQLNEPVFLNLKDDVNLSGLLMNNGKIQFLDKTITIEDIPENTVVNLKNIKF